MSLRVAAVGDLHVQEGNAKDWARALEHCDRDADLLLLAGDLTQEGTPRQAEQIGELLARVPVPVVGVLGNHDHESGCMDLLEQALRAAGVHLLEGDAVRLEIAGLRVGIAGTKGFGGGFHGACGSAFGEAEMKLFMAVTERAAAGLRAALRELDREPLDCRIALTHYAPVQTTLAGERLEIYPFLGSQMLEDAIDCARVDLAVHGHAHSGTEIGRTARGTPVRNVAYPLVREPYRVYVLPGAERAPIQNPAALPYLPGLHA